MDTNKKNLAERRKGEDGIAGRRREKARKKRQTKRGWTGIYADDGDSGTEWTWWTE
jgi:hypothetical protein